MKGNAQSRGVNYVSFRQKLSNYRKHKVSFAVMSAVYICMAITLLSVIVLIVYILAKGIPNLKPSLFSPVYTEENVSMLPAIFNTLIMTAMSLGLAVPIGIFTAIYLVEYASKGNKLVKIIRITAETLSGIPSIVYGLFGYLFFNLALRFDYSLLGGALTLSIMILPVMIRTTEEALLAVPDSYREGAFGLGAGRLRTVFKIVLPSAVNGIFAGVVLSMGRIIGETAALIYTSGTATNIPKNVMGSGRTLSVHLYVLMNEGLHIKEAYATAVVILGFVLLLNFFSSRIAKKLKS